MQSVSSNAVAQALSYSTTEQLTGGKWIDGKPIYRIGAKVNANFGVGSLVTLLNITNLNIGAIVNMGCIIYNRNRYWTDGNEPSRSKIFVDNVTKNFVASNEGSVDYGASVFYAFLEYIKTS